MASLKVLRISLLIVAIALPVYAGITLATAQEATDDAGVTDPSGPSWVNSDGTVNRDELPDTIGVLGPDGRVVGYADASVIFGAPPAPGTARALDSDGDGEVTGAAAVEMNAQFVGYVDENGFHYIEDLDP